MHEFDFLEPATLAEASRMAADLGDGVRFIAGGTALVLTLRQRMVRPSHLISLGRIDSLRGIDVGPDGGLRIGALTRHAEIAGHAHVRAHWPMLAGMAARLANPQVRNQGTIGGNLCYADPATDPPACLLALGARVVLASHRGTRELALEDFLVDYYETALGQDELLQEIRLPALPPGARGVYARFLRTAAEHRPLATVATVVQVEGDVCTRARIAVGAAVPVAQRLPSAEAELAGFAITRERIEHCAANAAATLSPLDDARGSAAYRQAMVRVQLLRSLGDAFGLERT
jgi:carbon-monoxide dehydrogenase medium subunit